MQKKIIKQNDKEKSVFSSLSKRLNSGQNRILFFCFTFEITEITKYQETGTNTC